MTYRKFGEKMTYTKFDESMNDLFRTLEEMKSEIEKLEIKLQESKECFDVADKFGRELFKEKEREEKENGTTI